MMIVEKKEQFVKMRDGAEIYTVVYDSGFEKTLLMIHGGPGASCDYFQYPAELISQQVNVVLFDKRGVRRSEAINPEIFNVQMLVDDIHDLKNALGLKSWSILGHSFGGLLALLYADQYREEVENIIFECPSFCNTDTNANIIDSISKELEKVQLYEDVERLKDAKQEGLSKLWGLINELPEDIITKLYHPYPRHEKVVALCTDSEITPEQWKKTNLHCERVIQDKLSNENHFSKLKKLTMPALLLLGEADIVTSLKQQEAFITYVEKGKKMVLPKCGHTLHNEIPELFAEKVLAFIKEH